MASSGHFPDIVPLMCKTFPWLVIASSVPLYVGCASTKAPATDFTANQGGVGAMPKQIPDVQLPPMTAPSGPRYELAGEDPNTQSAAGALPKTTTNVHVPPTARASPLFDHAKDPPETRAETTVFRPTPNAIRVAHNSRVVKLRSLVIQGKLEARWLEDGKARLEVGETTVWYRRPGCVAMSFMKAGTPVLWTACNPNFYWGINRSEKIGLIGRTLNVKSPFEELSPMIMHPLDLFQSLGLIEIPADAASSTPGEVLRNDMGRTVGLVTFLVKGPRVQQLVTIDEEHSLVRSIEFRDPAGLPLGLSRLSGYAPVKAVSAAPVPELLAPQELAIESLIANAKVTIRAHYVGEAPPDKAEIDDAIFDFERTFRSLNVREVVVLDAKAKFPAMSAADVERVLPGVKVIDVSRFPRK
jgi:hypothetical protein